ncbi:hypothetical protein ACFWVP_02850 [Streptomyces sp. NPDC058637]|uniref:hypothetical protein n=1 Tax=Streptomyces sp. NPDC058637 TaxID=3346569 RepID=UPI00365E663B
MPRRAAGTVRCGSSIHNCAARSASRGGTGGVRGLGMTVAAEVVVYPAIVLSADRLGQPWPTPDPCAAHEAVLPKPAQRPVEVLRRLSKSSIDLDDEAGRHWLEQTMSRYDVHVGAPPN